MATTSPRAPWTVQVAGLSNAQQQADGLPSLRIYANIPGSPPLTGPRAPGMSTEPNGLVTDSAGFPLQSPQDPAPIPPVGRIYRRSPVWTARPPKPMWEPSQYVPGKGWVNSATSG